MCIRDRVRGGLALSTIGSGAVFAAASGSSVATTGTLGTMAAKEMVDAGYGKTLVSGVIVAGGGLGILIPPSTVLILYATLTEQSVGKLLVAGILPGIFLTALFMVTVWAVVAFRPQLAPPGLAYPWLLKLRSLLHISWFVGLFLLVIGGMYIGLFSPTEAAGVGAVAASMAGLLSRRLSWGKLYSALSNSARTTGFIFAIVLASFLLNHLLAISGLAAALAEFVGGVALPEPMIFAVILGTYLLLGCFMDAFAMIVVTVPLMLPIIEAMGQDPIWFGVVVVLMVELALITPPIGMNNFVLNGVAPSLGLANIFKGALIFVVPIISLVWILYFAPVIATYLPSQM